MKVETNTENHQGHRELKEPTCHPCLLELFLLFLKMTETQQKYFRVTESYAARIIPCVIYQHLLLGSAFQEEAG